MSTYYGLDWLAMLLTFAALYLLGNRSRAGFIVMMGGNLCWASIGIWARSPAMLLANLVFLAMNARAWRRWRTSE